MEKNKKIFVIDLFAGCGGMSLGFKNAGFEIIAAFDNWEPTLRIYKANFHHQIYNEDLSKLNGTESLWDDLKAEVIIGGPPCQDFSHAGKRKESKRANLTISFAQIVVNLKPKFFIMENVARAVSSQTFKVIREMFKNNDYGITEKIIDASLCGVPQKRKRVFMIGELCGQDGFLDKYIEENLSKKSMTIKEYYKKTFNKIPTFQHYYRHPRNYNRRGIYSIDEPSMTIRGVNRPLPPNYPGHPADSTKVSKSIRPLTTKERSYIQTFPDSFILLGTKTTQEQIIGNAVPVKMAEFIAKCLLEYITSPKKFIPPCKQLELFV